MVCTTLAARRGARRAGDAAPRGCRRARRRRSPPAWTRPRAARAAAAVAGNSGRCAARMPSSVMRRSDPRFDQRFEQRPDTRVGRLRQRPRRIERGEHAVVEDADARRERERLAHVVRDDDDGLAHAADWIRRNSPMELGARDRVERAEWLVHQEDRRVGRERARHADALALAAGELARAGAHRSDAGRPTRSSSRATRAPGARRRPSRAAAARPLRSRRRSCAGRDRSPAGRSRCCRLSSKGSHARVSRPSTRTRPLDGSSMPVDQLQDRAFPRTAPADERDRLSVGNRQIESAQHLDRTAPCMHGLELDSHGVRHGRTVSQRGGP